MIRITSYFSAILLFGSSSAGAAAWLVPSQVSTIAAGLDSAASGDTVVVAAGTYLENDLTLKSGVTVRGATGDPADVTVDGQMLGRLFDGVGLTGGRLEGLTLTNGDALPDTGTGDSGGAIRLQSSPAFVVANCIFNGNTAKFGGAIAAFDSAPTVENCEFSSNDAAGESWATGGAIHVDGGAPVVRTCTFTGNTATAVTAPGDGGAIFARTTATVVEDCVFSMNSAGAGAGACYSWDGDASLYERCTFDQNVSDAGGALYLETSNARITECDFTGNSAENGGAIFIDQQSDPRFEGCDFTGNGASPNAGGAVDSWASTPEFDDCTFTANTATGRGGALSFNGASDAVVRNGTFVGNSSASAGGAIRLAWTSILLVETSTILESGGGAIRLQDWTTLLVDRSIIAFSTTGRAVTCTEAGTAALVDSNVHGNPAGNWSDCIAGQLGSNGNISADPLFCNQVGGDYTLTLPHSPCTPENSPSGVLIGRWPAGCGCPPADIHVPGDYPTIASALLMASPGDVVGVCGGTYAEAVTLRSGVHLVGTSAELTRVEWPGAGSEPALVVANGIVDSTVVADITFDAVGGVAQVVLAESMSTGLHLQRNRITGGLTDGVVNGPDSFIRIGGDLEFANDIYDNGGASPRYVRNQNVTADSLDALLNFWGTTRYDSILTWIEGKVRSCPITDSTHTKILCAPLTALPAPTLAAADAISLAAHPNPFRGDCRIALSLRQPGLARLDVFDVRGRRVSSLHDGLLPAGTHTLVWNGRDGGGNRAAPGIYFLRLEAGAASLSRKLVHLR